MDNVKELLGLQTVQKKHYTDFLLGNDILHVHVPPKITHMFQPLDINVKCVAKDFVKDKFG